MNTLSLKQKTFVSEINLTFALLIIIKLLMMLALPYWSLPFGKLMDMLGIEDTKAALEDLSSTANISGLCICIALYIFCVSAPVSMAFSIKKGHYAEDHAYYTGFPSLFQTLCAVGTTFTISYTVTAILYLAFSFIAGMLGYNFTPPTPETPDGPGPISLFILYLCILPALSEEFLTRGLVANALKKFGKGFAVVVSAIVFMMMHSSVANYAFSLFAGLCIGYFALRFNSIWLGVIIHLCINLNSAVFQIIDKNLGTFEGQQIYMIYFFAVAIFSLTFFFSFIFIFKIRRVGAMEEKPVFQKRLLLKCPFFYIFIVIFLISSWIDIMSLLH